MLTVTMKNMYNTTTVSSRIKILITQGYIVKCLGKNFDVTTSSFFGHF